MGVREETRQRDERNERGNSKKLTPILSYLWLRLGWRMGYGGVVLGQVGVVQYLTKK